MSVSYWQDKGADAEVVVVDVVVIGAGIAGASVAYWLKDSGLTVAVVDRGDCCAGASGRNAGFVTCGSVEHFSRQVKHLGIDKAVDLWRMSERNIDLIQSELVENGVDCDFVRRGTYSLAGSDHELAELHESARMMRELGITVEIVDERDIHRDLSARGFSGGVLYVDDGEVHPEKLVRSILGRSGAAFFPYHEVFSIIQHKESVTVHTRLRQFSSQLVVLATNGYSAQVEPYFVDKIYPTRGQIIVTAPVSPFLRAPCYANFVLDYFRQLPDGRVLIGGFRQLAKESETGTADEINPVIHEALERFLQTHFEILANVSIDYRWSGTMGFSADGIPMIGSLPHKPSVYFVGGFTGHGMGWGFYAGQMVRDLILEGKVPPHLSARRFR
ncbi:MAG: FAD-binding oxidoreductase [Myxococcales bacterium]|nr:FAD-binding oxidoreductase [Myxococcales bacterium]